MAEATDFLKADFLRDYQAMAQQSWDTWSRQWQQPNSNPFVTPPRAPASGSDTLDRTLAGLKGYFDWMQSAAMGGAPASVPGDWRQQVQQMFGGPVQPFAQAFGGIDSSAAEGFTRQWQSWLQAAQRGGMGAMPEMSPTPAFGLDREQQMAQQALGSAVVASVQATARYQALIQRANQDGLQRLQEKLTERAGTGQQVDSLKALYDLWVDAAEEAYAAIALSDEFREAYGEMVNTQMRVRQLQQQQTEQICQQLGVPTRSEVSSLGERLQALRREFRASQAAPVASEQAPDEMVALRRELAALKRQLAARSAPGPARAKPAAKAATKKAGSTRPAAKSARKIPAARKSSATRPTRRK